MVHLVALLEPAQDRDGVVDAGLPDVDGLEPALERGVLLDVLAVLVERGRADQAELAAGEHRLDHVAGVDRALGAAGADDRVELVDERDDLALGVCDLLQDGLEPLLELAAVLRARDHRADVERDDALVAQTFGHVALDDAPREALDDGGLADAGLTDEHGVVLRPARQHLDDAPDLLVASDDRVELALAGLFGEVAPEPLEGLVLVLGVLARDPVAAAHVLERGEHGVVGDAEAAQEVTDAARHLGHREEDVLGGEIVVVETGALLVGGLEDPVRVLRQLGLLGGLPVHLGKALQGFLDPVPHRPGRDSDPLEHRQDHALGLADQRREQVLGRHLAVVLLPRQGLRRLEGFSRLAGESVGIEWHTATSVWSTFCQS